MQDMIKLSDASNENMSGDAKADFPAFPSSVTPLIWIGTVFGLLSCIRWAMFMCSADSSETREMAAHALVLGYIASILTQVG